MSQLSPNFTLEELTFSSLAARKGIPNVPNDAAVANLTRLCTDVLEPARTLLGVPLFINSGYRSPALNDAVGSTSGSNPRAKKHSAHIDGRAADFVPVGLSLLDAFNMLHGRLTKWDQLILECNSWIHISVPDAGAQPRYEALTASGSPGNWTYSVVA